MLVDIPFIADWKKIGEHRQPTYHNTDCENESQIDYDNKVVKKYSYGTMVFLRKSESRNWREPWLTTSVDTNGTIRVQCGNKSEKINIQRVKLFDDKKSRMSGNTIIKRKFYPLNFLHSQQKTHAW